MALVRVQAHAPHREFSFTIADDVYIRYQCFGDAKGMREAIQKRQPHKIDIGAVFSSLPKDHAGGNKGGASATTERELVFDIDLTDYDDIRTCCSGAKICNKCWSYMTMAIKARATRRRRRRARPRPRPRPSRHVHLRAHARARAARLSVSSLRASRRAAVMDRALREDLARACCGSTRRRRVHCWVCDEGARAMSNEARAACVEYPSVPFGGPGSGTGGERKQNSIVWPPHPALARAFKVLEPLFVKHVIGPDGRACSTRPSTGRA